MLLQTIVQLHILLAAAPALVGWPLLMPATQAAPAHVAYCTSQRCSEGHAYASPAASPRSGARTCAVDSIAQQCSAGSGAPAVVLPTHLAAAALRDQNCPFPLAPRAP